MKMFKRIIAVALLLITMATLAACQVGSNYSAEVSMAATKDQLPVIQKDQKVVVPYTGGTPVEIVEIKDPVEAGLCDEDGKMLDGSGTVDLEAIRKEIAAK